MSSVKLTQTRTKKGWITIRIRLAEVYWHNNEVEKAGDANRQVHGAPLREDVAAVVEELRKLNQFEDADKLEKFHRLKSK